MEKELIGIISGLLVIISAVPYIINTWNRSINPNITSWSLWTMIGLALLLTYDGSGAGSNVWPAIFGFINPLIITLVKILRQEIKWNKFTGTDKYCFWFGVISLILWLFLKESRELIQYALYLAIVADAFAAIPTIIFLWKSPWEDKPFAWSLFALGYGLAILAIPENTFTNWVLPIYMFMGANLIALPLIIYRVKKRIPLKQWI